MHQLVASLLVEQSHREQGGLAVVYHKPLTILLLQSLEVGYLIYSGRYFYPILIIAFSLAAMVGLATTLHKQHSKVMALMNKCRLTPLVHEKWVRATASYRLVPGDVIVLQKGRALCDMVLLRGLCLVTESMLSGEVPIPALQVSDMVWMRLLFVV